MSNKESGNTPGYKFTGNNTTTLFPEIDPDKIELKAGGGGVIKVDDSPEPPRDSTKERLENFRNDLESLINTHSLEGIGGDTPDFILADYLTECLVNFGNAVKIRTKWYGGTE